MTHCTMMADTMIAIVQPRRNAVRDPSTKTALAGRVRRRQIASGANIVGHRVFGYELFELQAWGGTMTPASKHPSGLRSIGFVLLFLAWLPVPMARAQNDVCALVPDPHIPGDQILRCGTTLTITPAPGTVYRAAGAGGPPPASVELDSGALLIEFHASKRLRHFQILTPLAIAAVRGTKWAVEAGSDQSSVLVLAGTVKVARSSGGSGVVLHPGQGVDVAATPGPLTVKTWSPERVHALLTRLGQ
jgi:hypothetical protein